jgi:hypothetical protein
MNRILTLAAIVEVLTGAALLAAPVFVVHLLLGGEISGVGLAAARVAGIAIIALGIACLPNRDSAPSRPLLGMLTYSILVTIYLAILGIRHEAAGSLLWPAVILHAILSALLARGLISPASTR